MPIPDNTLSRAGSVDAFTVSGSTATIDDTWHGRLARFSQGCTVTVPVGLRVGFSCGFDQEGQDPVTFVAGDGAELQSFQDRFASSGQFALGGLYAVPQAEEESSSVYRMYGELA